MVIGLKWRFQDSAQSSLRIRRAETSAGPTANPQAWMRPSPASSRARLVGDQSLGLGR